MDSSQKILSLVYPPVNGYAHQCALFSMLFTRQECIPWIYNNFIQVYSLKDLYLHSSRTGTIDFFYNIYGDWKHFYFKANPWIRFSAIPFYDLRSFKLDCIKYLKLCIERDMYLYFDVDIFFIPVYTKYYLQKHQKREILVYGYSDEKQCFFTLNNTKAGKCTQDHVSYKNLEESILFMDEFDKNNEALFWRERQIYMMEVTKNVEASGNDPLFLREIFETNIEQIINGVKEYLLDGGTIRAYGFSEFYVFGTDCYDELIKYIDHIIKTKGKADIRGFYSFFLHKKLMLMRLEYLSDKYDLVETTSLYKTLVDDFNVLIIKLIKADILKKDSIFAKLIDSLNDLKEREISLLKKFIQLINNDGA